MKMVKLNLSIFLLFLSTILYSQNNVNLIIIINDEIITSPLKLNFRSQSLKKEYKIVYHPGKELDVANNDIFKENMILEFDAYGDKKHLTKRYNYNISLQDGLFNDTSFLIIKIYNIDNKKYKKRNCKTNDSYIVGFENGRYSADIFNCK